MTTTAHNFFPGSVEQVELCTLDLSSIVPLSTLLSPMNESDRLHKHQTHADPGPSTPLPV
ncbi:uncharacterized protein GLRG_04844 [Colletotrichum graminicola M1.001]|uniref:Uncharacterized protein n=1 Tax=Colletotrichum graminicola (strain M1.001 / M2 / FGSC 10212) TaxID=645133 RepID=E3QGA4_COLGM|nr:uncharacterized protein GLRG_04844 [Colletotrichum graminicola M1.001]EFQ29700.1 hypothetical protein GLRG_04844 [Colletotrichum graminicola M1.001]